MSKTAKEILIDMEKLEIELARVIRRIENTRVKNVDEPITYRWHLGDVETIESRDDREAILPTEKARLEARRDELKIQLRELQAYYERQISQENIMSSSQIKKCEAERKEKAAEEREKIQEIEEMNNAREQARSRWNAKSGLYRFFHKAPTAKILDNMSTDQINNLYRKR